MAFGTGLVVGYFSTIIMVIYAPPINSIIGSFIAFVIYQFISFERMLNEAISKRPNDLMVCYRLAVCCVLDGLVEDAIHYYKLASNNPYLISTALRKFITAQVERIELKGPMNRPPVLGARYQAW